MQVFTFSGELNGVFEQGGIADYLRLSFKARHDAFLLNSIKNTSVD